MPTGGPSRHPPPTPSSPLRAQEGPAAGEIPADTLKRLRRLAIAALARREHSRAELKRKLAQRLQEGENPALVSQVLDELQARALLSDQRMAQSLVRTRAHRYGRLRLAQELQQRGVDRETLAQSLPSPQDERAAALALWQRKFGQAPANLQERARQSRFLLARGFPPALVARIVGGSDD